MLLVPTELRKSPIHGIGVFLLAPVKKGEAIWRFDARIDRIYTRTEMNALPKTARAFVEIYATWHKDSDSWVLSGDNAKYMNHSIDPSAAAAGHGSFADDIAAYDLPAGTELTCNYHHCYDNKDVLARMGLVEAQ